MWIRACSVNSTRSENPNRYTSLKLIRVMNGWWGLCNPFKVGSVLIKIATVKFEHKSWIYISFCCWCALLFWQNFSFDSLKIPLNFQTEIQNSISIRCIYIHVGHGNSVEFIKSHNANQSETCGRAFERTSRVNARSRSRRPFKTSIPIYKMAPLRNAKFLDGSQDPSVGSHMNPDNIRGRTSPHPG